MMRRSLVLGFVATFTVASVALAATGAKAPHATLGQAVYRTTHAPSMRYSMTIAVTRRNHPAVQLRIHGTRSAESLFIHVKAFSTVLFRICTLLLTATRMPAFCMLPSLTMWKPWMT